MKYLLIPIIAFSLIARQSLAESSLSALGYGKQFEASSARSAGMGLASIAIADSLSLDLVMPANWSGPRSAKFGFSSYSLQEKVTDNSGSESSDNGGIGGIGFVVPVGRTSFLGLSITPVTMMDYRWRSTGSTAWSTTLTRRQGQGGISQGLLGGSLLVNDRLRVGLAIRPIFGKVERLWKLEYPSGGAYSASQTISDRFAGLGISFSSNWRQDDWSAGLLFNTPVSAKIQRQEVIGAGGTAQVDSTYELSEQYDLPFDLGIGFGKTFNRHLFAIDFVLHGWGSVDPPSIDGGKFENSYRLSTGWEYSPEYRSLDPFWRAWVYRGGLMVSNAYGLSSSDHQAQKIAVTAGLGIPYAKGRSRLDLAIEYGLMGDKTEDGAHEQVIGVTLGFNHSETWFVSRRGR